MVKKENEHSPNYDKVKYYYDHGQWTIAQVRKAVQKGWITEEEFYEITGENY